MGATKKPAGKLGLGLKKLENKVDEALFDQAPAPEPAPAPPKPSDPLTPGGALAAAAAVTAAAAAASPSRFSYNPLNAVRELLGVTPLLSERDTASLDLACASDISERDTASLDLACASDISGSFWVF